MSFINIRIRPERQPPGLRLPLHQRVPLVKLDTVIAACGLRAEAVYARVDNGTLRWVFNLSSRTGSGTRDLRFWNRELAAFATRDPAHPSLRQMPIAEAVDEIIGPRTQFYAGDVCLLLGIRRPTLQQLRIELQGPVTGQLYPRPRLEQFLCRRIAGICL